MSASTGFTLSSSTAPSGFTFANPLPVAVSAYTTSINEPNGMAFDSSGNAYTGNLGSHTISKLSVSGALLQTFSPVGYVVGVAIDAAGNVWGIHAAFALFEFNPSGTKVFTTSSSMVNPQSILIDPAGNVWMQDGGNHTVKEFNASGTTLGTYSVPSTGCFIDIDSSQNIWVSNGQAANALEELNSSGSLLATYSLSSESSMGCDSIGVDPSGNIWFANYGGSTVYFFPGITAGPQYFPYSGPMWP